MAHPPRRQGDITRRWAISRPEEERTDTRHKKRSERRHPRPHQPRQQRKTIVHAQDKPQSSGTQQLLNGTPDFRTAWWRYRYREQRKKQEERKRRK